MQAQIILRIVARSAHHFIDLAAPASRDFHPCADCRAVRPRANTLDHEPVAFVTAVVTQQRRRTVQVIDDHIHIAIVVQVAECTASRQVFFAYRRPNLQRNIFEAAIAEIAVQDFGLPISDVQLPPLNLRIHMPVGNKQVFPAIVIEIRKADAETEIFPVNP